MTQSPFTLLAPNTKEIATYIDIQMFKLNLKLWQVSFTSAMTILAQIFFRWGKDIVFLNILYSNLKSTTTLIFIYQNQSCQIIVFKKFFYVHMQHIVTEAFPCATILQWWIILLSNHCTLPTYFCQACRLKDLFVEMQLYQMYTFINALSSVRKIRSEHLFENTKSNCKWQGILRNLLRTEWPQEMKIFSKEARSI